MGNRRIYHAAVPVLIIRFYRDSQERSEQDLQRKYTSFTRFPAVVASRRTSKMPSDSINGVNLECPKLRTSKSGNLLASWLRSSPEKIHPSSSEQLSAILRTSFLNFFRLRVFLEPGDSFISFACFFVFKAAVGLVSSAFFSLTPQSPVL